MAEKLPTRGAPHLKRIIILVLFGLIVVGLGGYLFIERSDIPDSSRQGVVASKQANLLAAAAGLHGSASIVPGYVGPGAPAGPSGSPLEQHRSSILQGRYGKLSIEELIRLLVETPGGPQIQLIYQALALRKPEALPIIQERLRTGGMWEKHMLTKFLRVSPWPETRDELVALARANTEHWLPRQGSLYALGALGDASVGADVIEVLKASTASKNLAMAAISTLARIGFKGGAGEITPFTQDDNIYVRLFAMHALAELGEPVDKPFLLTALQSKDYVVRQEASAALGAVVGQDVLSALMFVAKDDLNEAVRDAASQAILRREIAGRGATEAVAVLEKSLSTSERLTSLWILRTALDKGEASGRHFVEALVPREDFLGERARAYLVFAEARTR